jgi:uncharacterized DUF497 family protein
MSIIFDPAKNAKNIAERRLSFELVAAFDWISAWVTEDTRKDYGEVRLQVLALAEGRLYAAVVTPRDGDLRVISLRKASRKEVSLYDEKTG